MAGINTLPSSATHASGQAAASHEARARHTTTTASSSGADEAAAARQQAVNDIATHLNNYFPGSSGMHEIVQDRARELHDMGETPESIAENMGKAQKMDYISEAVGGAVKAFPFAISGYAAGAIKLGAGVAGTSVGSEALGGAIDGATAMVLKSVGDKVFAPVVKDSLWLAADAEKLEPEMQEVLKKRQGLGESLKLAPLGSQGFNGRNAAVGTVATLTHNNPQVISHTSNVLSLAAGSAGGVLTNKFSASHGPEFLLGRTDWKAQYSALKATSVKQQMTSGGAERLKTLLLSLMTPRNYAKGALNITSGNMVSEIGGLALGLAGNNALRNVARNPGVGEAVSSAPSAAIDEAIGRLGAGELTSSKEIAKDQAINLVGAALAYAFQGIAGTLAGPAPTRNDEAVDFLADKVVNSLVGQKTGEVRDKSVDALQSGARQAGQFTVDKAVYTKNKVTEGANALADGAVRTGNAVGSGLSSAKTNVSEAMSSAKGNVSEAMNSAQQWAGEQFRQRFASQQQPAQAMPATSAQPAAQPSVQASAQTGPQPTVQASTSQAAVERGPQPTTQAPASQPAARTTPQAQASVSQAGAQTVPQPAVQAPASQAPTSTTPAGSRPTTQPVSENIEMQPMGKSKQA